MTRSRKRVMTVAVAGGLLLAAAAWFFVDVTARRSSFCANCHYMTPYVEQWKASAHSRVECVVCHPVKRRTMLASLVKYSAGVNQPKPRATVPDAACTRPECHPSMPEAKPVPFKGVGFPHAIHIGLEHDGMKLACASCHGASGEAGHVSVDQRICFLCHFKGQGPAGTLAGCGTCHGAPGGTARHGGFLFDMKAYVDSGVQCSRCHLSVHEGEGEVAPEKCFACHVSRRESIKDVGRVHSVHVSQRQIACLDCHEPIRHGNIKVLSVLDVSCETCHANLHSGPKEMYLGVGAKGAPDTPSRMFAAQINCTGCHTRVTTVAGTAFLGQSNKQADPLACAACHDARYVPMVAAWKSQGTALVAEARRLASEGARLAASAKDRKAAGDLASELDFNARFLEQGHPVHNIEYAVKVVQASRSILKTLAESAGRSAPADSGPAFARDDFAYCGPTCHGFIPRKEPYDFKGTDFPHTYHTEKAGLSCDTCHEGGRHKAMVLASPSDCASCHHDSAKADCARCHPRQAALYTGKVPPSVGIAAKADVMAESVACADCHDPTQADALQNIGKACEGCHDAQAPKELAAWRADVDEVKVTTDLLRQRGGGDAPYRRRLDAVRARLDYLSKARPLHNVDAARAEFDRSESELRAILNDLSTKLGAAPPR